MKIQKSKKKFRPLSKNFIKNLKEGDIIHMMIIDRDSDFRENYGKEMVLKKFLRNNSINVDLFSFEKNKIENNIDLGAMLLDEEVNK